MTITGEIWVTLDKRDPTDHGATIQLYDSPARGGRMTHRLAILTPCEHIPQKVGDLLAGAKFAPYGPVVGHDRIKHCTSLPGPIGRHLLVEYCDREELA